MARFQFGKGEGLECLPGIPRFDIRTAEGTENVCYAAKVVTESVFLPWRTYVDGYVFSVDGNTFYNATGESVRVEQALGNLPPELPKYQIEPAAMFFGHLLWPALILGAVYCFYGARGHVKTESGASTGKELASSESSTIYSSQDQLKD